MRKLGCLIVVLLLAVVAFYTRDWWWPRVRAMAGGAPPAAPAATWQPLTPDGATRGRKALQQLSGPRGPVYVNVAPGDLAAYIVQELSRTLPAGADSVEAGAFGDRLAVRAVVDTKDLGGSRTLGPLAMLLGDRERVQMAGTLRIVRPGLAELQVKEMKLGSLAVPPPLIPRLIRQISPATRPAGMSPDGLPLTTPPYIADVRVSDGRITLYKAAAP